MSSKKASVKGKMDRNYLLQPADFESWSIKELEKFKSTDHEAYEHYRIKKLINLKYFKLILDSVEEKFLIPFILYDKKNRYKYIAKLCKIKPSLIVFNNSWDSYPDYIIPEMEDFDQNTIFKYLHQFYENEEFHEHLDPIKNKNIKSEVRKKFLEMNPEKLTKRVKEDWFSGDAKLNFFEYYSNKFDPVTLLTGVDKLDFIKQLVKANKISKDKLFELFEAN
jgi:thiol-disulfide isomerase/thioredoxin